MIIRIAEIPMTIAYCLSLFESLAMCADTVVSWFTSPSISEKGSVELSFGTECISR